MAEQRLRSGDGFHIAPPSPVLLDSKHKGSGYRAISKFPRFQNSPDRAKGREGGRELPVGERSPALGPSVSRAHGREDSEALKRFWSLSITGLKFKIKTSPSHKKKSSVRKSNEILIFISRVDYPAVYFAISTYFRPPPPPPL